MTHVQVIESAISTTTTGCIQVLRNAVVILKKDTNKKRLRKRNANPEFQVGGLGYKRGILC